MLLAGRQVRHLASVTMGVVLLVVTVSLEFCMSYELQMSPPSPSSLAQIKSRMKRFWYQPTRAVLENGH